MFERFKKLFARETPTIETSKKSTQTRSSKKKIEKSEKELATERDEPYVAILRVDLDPNNINSGAFTLDWNSKFAANLARAGYQKKPGETEDIIVDRWFQEVCRNIALEVYEQEMADPINRELDDLRKLHKRDLGNGRSEIS
jgi:hypothetical protein